MLISIVAGSSHVARTFSGRPILLAAGGYVAVAGIRVLNRAGISASTIARLRGIQPTRVNRHAPRTTHDKAANSELPLASVSTRHSATWRGLRSLLALLVSATWTLGCSRPTPDSPPEAPESPRVIGDVIQFSAAFSNLIQMRTVEVQNRGVVPAIAVVGTVAFDPQHVSRVGTRLRGLVRDVRRYEGDTVKSGEHLASIDSPELGEAQATVASLQAELGAAKHNSIREKQLAEEKLTTLKESEEAVALEQKYQALLAAARQRVFALAGPSESNTPKMIGVHEIVSPIKGTIVERRIAQGQLIDGNHTAFLIANLDTLWVELAVFEKQLPLIRVGDEVDLRPLGNHADQFKGKVANVGQVLDTLTRSAPVRIEVDNRLRHLRAGQAVDALIHAGGAAVGNGPVVPPEAITFVDGKPTAFVQTSATTVRVTPVELGLSDGREQRVTRGLTVGERVVISGTFELKSELFR